MQRLLLTILIIDIPLQLGTHLDLREDATAVGSLGGFDVSLTTIALVGLYFSWWTGSLVRADHRLQPSVRLSVWPILYILFVAISTVVARDVTLSLFELFLLLQMLLLYVYISSNANSRDDVIFVVTVLMLGLVLESFLMIGIASGGRVIIRISGHSLRAISTTFGRIGGTVGSPNVAAGYLSVLLAPAISLLLTDLKRWYKGLAMLAFGLGVVSLILTGSRGGWVACAVSMTTLYVFASRGRRIWLPVAIAGNFVVIVALLFQDVIMARWYGGVSSTGAAARLPLIKLAWQVIKDNPLLGVGANNFATVAKDYLSPDIAWHDWFSTVHNKYLVVWAETGIGGLLAFLGFVIVTIRGLWQCWKRNDHFLSPLALGFMAGILGMMTHMLVDYFRARAVIQVFWLIAGLATVMQISATPAEYTRSSTEG